jgi:hypothetical protein
MLNLYLSAPVTTKWTLLKYCYTEQYHSRWPTKITVIDQWHQAQFVAALTRMWPCCRRMKGLWSGLAWCMCSCRVEGSGSKFGMVTPWEPPWWLIYRVAWHLTHLCPLLTTCFLSFSQMTFPLPVLAASSCTHSRQVMEPADSKLTLW